MEFYPRGNWIVGTPLWVQEDQDPADRMAMMVCPHPKWDEKSREVDENSNDGLKYLVVSEKCAECGVIRLRLLPEGVPEEPFDYSIPVRGSWYERLYGFENFVILVRRYNENPEVPPAFMTRVETSQGNVHTGMVQLPTMLFSPAAVAVMKDMEKVIRVGSKRYADFRILKENRHGKQEKDDIRAHADSLFRVAQDIGAEPYIAARAILEAEIEQEAIEMEANDIETMEREVAMRKASLKQKSKKPK